MSSLSPRLLLLFSSSQLTGGGSLVPFRGAKDNSPEKPPRPKSSPGQTRVYSNPPRLTKGTDSPLAETAAFPPALRVSNFSAEGADWKRKELRGGRECACAQLCTGEAAFYCCHWRGRFWPSAEAFRGGGVKEATYDCRLFIALPGKDMVLFPPFQLSRSGPSSFAGPEIAVLVTA